MMSRVPTWFVVLIGLLFNILAALISHFFIDAKTNQLNSLSMQMSNNDKEIGLLWEQIEGIERKREIFYLLVNQGEINKTVASQFVLLLEKHLHQKVRVDDIQVVDNQIDLYQEAIRNEIDSKFFLNLELVELQMHLRSEVSTLRNWSIFLQMIGLSLILARDLSRKHHD
ncbi:hypothetical protein CW745_14460 [Psychromonas sp. psych-6C06]|uniref:hypothetical protein n=1 Tax=Psychromonas sp. psych-6C06 TaxID=2058089 RepID=UPI000C34854D|nr:hypothetical protein [Psychromonas sp. psych-6C06]PKF60538.1 hypothetical protein CW745_14460 [Psychromonas sp. psych-6C06]